MLLLKAMLVQTYSIQQRRCVYGASVS